MATDVVGLPRHDGRNVGITPRSDEESAEILHARGTGPGEQAQSDDSLNGVPEQDRESAVDLVAQPALEPHLQTGKDVGRSAQKLGNAGAEAELVVQDLWQKVGYRVGRHGRKAFNSCLISTVIIMRRRGSLERQHVRNTYHQIIP